MTTTMSVMAAEATNAVVLFIATVAVLLTISSSTNNFISGVYGDANATVLNENNIADSMIDILPTSKLIEYDQLSLQNATYVSTIQSLFTTTIVEPTKCLHMNEVLWEYQKDATTLTFVKAIFALFYSLIIIFGVLGNLCVILSISRTRSLQTVPNMFIFSLSCSDIVVCCTSATITPITAFEKEWLFGQFLCSVAPFIAGVSLCFSTFTLAAISLDRFMLIRFPMKKPFSHAQAFFIIFLICIMAMGLSMPIMFMQKLRPINKYCGQFCYEDWGANHSQRRAYGTLMLALQFIIPLFVIIFCYTAISVRLGQSVILKSKNGSAYHWQLQMTDQQRAATKRRQRTNRMFIAMVVAFSTSWIWTLLFNLFRDYEILPSFVKRQEFFFGILTHCIAMTSTVWNPLLYALLNLQLRAAFVQLMPDCLREYLTKRSKNDNLPKTRHTSKLQSSAKDNSMLIDDIKLSNGDTTIDTSTKKRSIGWMQRRRSSILSLQNDLCSTSNQLLDKFTLMQISSVYDEETTTSACMENGEEIRLHSSNDIPLLSTSECNLSENFGKAQSIDSRNATYGSFDVLSTPVIAYTNSHCYYSPNFENNDTIGISYCNYNANTSNDNALPNIVIAPIIQSSVNASAATVEAASRYQSNCTNIESISNVKRKQFNNDVPNMQKQWREKRWKTIDYSNVTTQQSTLARYYGDECINYNDHQSETTTKHLANNHSAITNRNVSTRILEQEFNNDETKNQRYTNFSPLITGGCLVHDSKIFQSRLQQQQRQQRQRQYASDYQNRSNHEPFTLTQSLNCKKWEDSANHTNSINFSSPRRSFKAKLIVAMNKCDGADKQIKTKTEWKRRQSFSLPNNNNNLKEFGSIINKKNSVVSPKSNYCPECRHNSIRICNYYGCECCANSKDNLTMCEASIPMDAHQFLHHNAPLKRGIRHSSHSKPTKKSSSTSQTCGEKQRKFSLFNRNKCATEFKKYRSIDIPTHNRIIINNNNNNSTPSDNSNQFSQHNKPLNIIDWKCNCDEYHQLVNNNDSTDSAQYPTLHIVE